MVQGTAPNPKVEIAFASDPTDTDPTWVDVTSDVDRLQIRRGKARVLDQTQAGRCTITLDNRSGDYTPGNSAGAHYPNVQIVRRVRVSLEFTDTTTYSDATATYNGDIAYGPIRIFDGFVDAWQQRFQDPAGQQTEVVCTDAFRFVNNTRITADYDAGRPGHRIGEVLDAAGWGDRRLLSDGDWRVGAASLVDANPLQHILDAADTDAGLLFVDVYGRFRFLSRDDLIRSPVRLTVGESEDEPYNPWQTVISLDDLDLFNEVRIDSDDLDRSTVTDGTSISTYGTRVLSKPLMHESQTDQNVHASYLLIAFADPSNRIPEISPHPDDTVDGWTRVLGRELGDKVTVTRRPPAGDTITQASYIEGVQLEWQPPRRWQVRWSLVPTTRRTGDWWVLGESALGSTTRLFPS